ncbi:MAG TPA: hypothetical protein VE980_20235, partial [Pyrinomonadaceae bacterium]|nr:hypothetical protein [Pyrinomonadaceae bacterium]
KCEEVFDYLKPGNVCQVKIYNTESEAPITRLFDSILPFCHKHDLVAVRLKHKPERVAYGRLVIHNEDG